MALNVGWLIVRRARSCSLQPAAGSGTGHDLDQFPGFNMSLELDSTAQGSVLFSSDRLNLAVVDLDLDGEAGFQLIDRLQGGNSRIPCIAWVRRTRRTDVIAEIKVYVQDIVTRRQPTG